MGDPQVTKDFNTQMVQWSIWMIWGVPPWPTTLLPWAALAKPLPWLQASAAATGNFWSLGDTTGSFGGSKKAERVFPHHLPGDVEAFVIDVFNSFQNGSSFLHVRSLSFYGFPSILAWFSTLFWWSTALLFGPPGPVPTTGGPTTERRREGSKARSRARRSAPWRTWIQNI